MAQKYKSTGNSAQLDQLYTNPHIAQTCFDGMLKLVSKQNRRVFLEPSAGNGSFSDCVLTAGFKCVAFDLDPKKPYIVRSDFFDVTADQVCGSFDEVCVIGNPPFGKNSSLAVRFFNHCAMLAGTICFVVPKTFKKQSIHNRLNLNFHLKKSIDLPKDSFLFNGEPYDVPCVFQIWQWKPNKRRKVKSKNECALFRFVKKEQADFAVRRAGGRAGTAFIDVNVCSEQSNHFCKAINKSAEEVVKLINSINFSVIANSTAGVRSVSKGELIRAIERKMGNGAGS